MRASRTFTFSNVDQLADPDAIKTSVATSTSLALYQGEDLNGAAASDGVARPAPNDHAGLAAYPTVTTSAQAGAYVPGSKVTFIGEYGPRFGEGMGLGAASLVQREAVIVEADGGETLVADGPLESVLAIETDAQAATSGALTFGFTDLAPKSGQRFVQIEGLAEGNLHVAYGDDEDTIPTNVGCKHECMPSRVFADSTAIFTLYRE